MGGNSHRKFRPACEKWANRNFEFFPSSPQLHCAKSKLALKTCFSWLPLSTVGGEAAAESRADRQFETTGEKQQKENGIFNSFPSE